MWMGREIFINNNYVGDGAQITLCTKYYIVKKLYIVGHGFHKNGSNPHIFISGN